MKPTSYTRNILAVLFISGINSFTLGDNSPSVERARADLAQRLQVPKASVLVVEQTEKTWTDSSMGCPVPGFSYLQVLVNGSQLVMDVGGILFYYHSGGSRDYFYCSATKKGPSRGPDS